MARALAYGGAAAAAAFGPPWLPVLMLSVWAITLAVLLCGDSSNSPRRPRYSGAGAGAAAELAASAPTVVPAVPEEAVVVEGAVAAAAAAAAAVARVHHIPCVSGISCCAGLQDVRGRALVSYVW